MKTKRKKKSQPFKKNPFFTAKAYEDIQGSRYYKNKNKNHPQQKPASCVSFLSCPLLSKQKVWSFYWGLITHIYTFYYLYTYIAESDDPGEQDIFVGKYTAVW